MVSFNIADHLGTKDFPLPNGEITPEQWKRDMAAFSHISEVFQKTAAMDCKAHREAFESLLESTLLPLLLYGLMAEWYDETDMSDAMTQALEKYMKKHSLK